MKKVLFAITNLEIGGAERVLVNLVNSLKDYYQITVLTLYGNGCLEKDISKEIKIQSIYSESYESMSFLKKKFCALQIKNSFLRRKLYQKYVKDKYDVEIAFLEGPMTEFLQEASSAKKIAWIHTDLEEHYKVSKYPSLLKTYQAYQSLVFVSKTSLDKFLKIDSSNSFRGNKQIIYNYMDFDIIKKLSQEKLDDKLSSELNFVVVARLVPAKGIERLMSVHQKLIKNKLKHHIYVVGDGPLKDSLTALQKEYHIEKTFHLLGQKINPYPYIKNGDYFLLPSLYEGYPVTLMEAMAINQYIIATNIASCEVLKDYPNKVIAENNEDGLYDVLKELIEEGKVRTRKKYSMTQNKNIIDEICKLIEGEK